MGRCRGASLSRRARPPPPARRHSAGCNGAPAGGGEPPPNPKAGSDRSADGRRRARFQQSVDCRCRQYRACGTPHARSKRPWHPEKRRHRGRARREIDRPTARVCPQAAPRTASGQPERTRIEHGRSAAANDRGHDPHRDGAGKGPLGGDDRPDPVGTRHPEPGDQQPRCDAARRQADRRHQEHRGVRPRSSCRAGRAGLRRDIRE